MLNTAPFLIVFTRDVTFRDSEGTIIRAFNKNDIVVATADTGSYFVTTMGGIYHEEARRVNGLELITYSNQHGPDRFRQYAHDLVPSWATDLRLDA